ncbi:embryonic polyadenylate-binding protein 2 isoform X1 [Gadus macrocephalus]|uniref:embryonic polyadenylate-binding protein 2 isoform X1 n=1 Tax=Gadus chalcogrammus TaxID=1042646 RepID=UPI0024C4DA28|nr:embryonic polyadenylate-binding protein 2 isoform X1 [Gadus chalcogrammus]XP_059928357.1 embryonic polyadenylate-binding protein 2 isoform X1 [Gadus macrocephalus]
MMMMENNDTFDYLDGVDGGGYFNEDPELAAIKARVLELEMEEEAERMREEEHCESAEMQLLSGSPQPGLFYNMTHEERIDADNRSVYVGNVDYGATADELEIHFNGCGPVNRVTILCDRFSGHPKGWVYPLPSHHLPLPSSTLTTPVQASTTHNHLTLVANLSLPGTPVCFAYIEFSDRDSVQSAIGLDETLFRGRVLKVMPKRTNMPGISTTDRGGPRGGGRSRGRGPRPPRYHNGFQGRFRYQSARPPHPVPHPYYGGPPAGKRQWGPPEYREQTSKRYPCLLLITPPSEEGGPGPSGHHYPQQR